jgi:hypothetical protein
VFQLSLPGVLQHFSINQPKLHQSEPDNARLHVPVPDLSVIVLY